MGMPLLKSLRDPIADNSGKVQADRQKLCNEIKLFEEIRDGATAIEVANLADADAKLEAAKVVIEAAKREKAAAKSERKNLQTAKGKADQELQDCLNKLGNDTATKIRAFREFMAKDIPDGEERFFRKDAVWMPYQVGMEMMCYLPPYMIDKSGKSHRSYKFKSS